ncbi:hypothetical protein PPERSA_07812 [Pseudocohnilembus persalinus]|uniref:Transmembrane protein n=1 Tax=Pseudocohnilembus persalinus TaxID=266149 RepID=A0A0V0QCB1_PSEPJ|nr:hypothetical protein PPERSA_07812 [Pseudocohnilembus persalinus]|eukprot:KRW99735.1 hypothetical protein PPERSA_07812 [Pseudocohnilembus persalinus]
MKQQFRLKSRCQIQTYRKQIIIDIDELGYKNFYLFLLSPIQLQRVLALQLQKILQILQIFYCWQIWVVNFNFYQFVNYLIKRGIQYLFARLIISFIFIEFLILAYQYVEPFIQHHWLLFEFIKSSFDFLS